jgi:hypothetical protein
MRRKEVEDNKTDIIFYDIEKGLRISEDNSTIEKGIFFDGVKITSVEEWNKAIEEFSKRKTDFIPKQVIRDKIKELEKEKKRYGFSSIESIICVNKIQALKEILGE